MTPDEIADHARMLAEDALERHPFERPGVHIMIRVAEADPEAHGGEMFCQVDGWLGRDT